MVKMITSAATVLVLMPVIWFSSAAWATALSVGLVCDEVTRRLRSTMGCCQKSPKDDAAPR